MKSPYTRFAFLKIVLFRFFYCKLVRSPCRGSDNQPNFAHLALHDLSSPGQNEPNPNHHMDDPEIFLAKASKSSLFAKATLDLKADIEEIYLFEHCKVIDKLTS